MDKEAAKFIVKEYLGLWEDFGLEELHPRVSEGLIRRARSRSSTSSTEAPPRSLSEVQARLGNCTRCPLSQGRTKIVFGSGNAQSKLVFVGEAPGSEEDAVGLPFVGEGGQLLSKIIEAIGYTRSDVYLTTLLKCQVAANAIADDSEIETCSPFLQAQLDVLRPQIVVALGPVVTTVLTGSGQSFSNLRGKFQRLRDHAAGFVMPTYPPEFLLKNPSAKRTVWEDMKLVRAKLENFQ